MEYSQVEKINAYDENPQKNECLETDDICTESSIIMQLLIQKVKQAELLDPFTQSFFH